MDINAKEHLNFLPSIFWDIDISSIDWDAHARFVIQRVVQRGRIEDWIVLKKMYGLDKIKTELLLARNLDSKTLHFFSTYFDIPKQNFRCYTMKQSFQGHWNY